MSETYKIGILGCGDFLRWQAGSMLKSEKIEVAALFDPDKSRAEKYAEKLGGKAVDSEDAIFNDDTIDIVCLFVPPWLRRAQVEKAVETGKHIITTKPLAPSIEDAEAICKAVDGKVKFGVLYCRTENAPVETCKRIFDSGEIGKLALYKQDWLHHYPSWNNWALDPEKNGGPFMDAMIHNLNIARYLMARPVENYTLFAENLAHPDLKCSDTDLMKVSFADKGSANLFITWAADLAVYSNEGNDREHIDIKYMITDKGWRITEEDGKVIASRLGETKTWPIEGLSQRVYDRFADAVANDGPIPVDMADATEACDDIKMVVTASQNLGSCCSLQ